MDQLLALVLALLVFAFFILLIERSFKYMTLLGIAVISYLVLLAVGVIG